MGAILPAQTYAKVKVYSPLHKLRLDTTAPRKTNFNNSQSCWLSAVGLFMKIRQKPPTQTQIITQMDHDSYVVYSGTEDNIRKRLKQHLFNEGPPETAKLGCVIDKTPFSEYQWRVSFAVTDSDEIRYAVETWWRLNVGWPVFCLR
jgi:hypothetical protein